MANVLFHFLRQFVYLCGLCERILCAFWDGTKVSAVDDSQSSHRWNNQQNKTRQAGRDVKLEDKKVKNVADNLKSGYSIKKIIIHVKF